ncbi:IS5 family transposase [Glycocaulis abyssi]|uniref:IS5 family transposase n=2 Tax=Alphaproteobacteria TaxID=28211 RepID=UPI003A93438C
MARLFWLSDMQWAAIAPHLPTNQPGARRVDDRRVISGIIHVLKTGCRWCDCPPEYGPPTTIYNRFNRWSRRRFWIRLLEALAASGAVTKSTAIDSTYVKAQRAAHGGKGGPKNQAIGPSRGGQTTKLHALTDVVGRPFALTLTAGNAADITVAPALLARAERVKYLIADKGYDGDGLRSTIRQAGAVPVIPGRANRKRKVRLDARRYRDRHLVENAFCRLKDFRRVATRYDKLAANFLSAAALAAIVAFWI